MQEAHRLAARPLADHLLEANESATADEQDICRVHRSELLVRMLPAALRRHVGNGPLEDLQQRLLDALARDVPGDGGILVLAADFIDLIYIDDSLLATLHISV